jgi:NAD(P)-dependent dehydrogenase (short-subunit alcohol dehydrogenase family)
LEAGASAVAASNGGVLTLSNIHARDLDRHRVRVNGIAPVEIVAGAVFLAINAVVYVPGGITVVDGGRPET